MKTILSLLLVALAIANVAAFGGYTPVVSIASSVSFIVVFEPLAN
jgi:hypothetical protein